MDQNERLLKNMKEYDKKKKAGKQKSKILESKPVKREANKRKETPMRNT